MLVLALETSADPCGMALVDEGGVVSSVRFRHHMNLSSTWAPLLQRMLAEVGRTPAQIAGVATSLGPGSFTGLRIGVVAAKTLAQTLQIKLLGIGSLELLALPFRAVAGLSVLCVLPCRRGEAYVGAYRCTGNALRGLVGGAVMPLESLAGLMASLPEPMVVAGAASHRPEDADAPRAADQWHHAPSAEVLGMEARRRMLAGESVEPAALLPIYLKRSQAEERLGTLGRPKAER
jgi:tRNA threonylcarbamoyladenosine biosynthesis protein TsaB